MITNVGNHEAGGWSRGSFDQDALFFYYFPFPKKDSHQDSDVFELDQDPYHVFDIEPASLALFALDSGHIAEVDRVQSFWLSENLKNREHLAFRVASYHSPIYPALSRQLEIPSRVKQRIAWVPLFVQHDVCLAFEYHTHQYKRTYPLSISMDQPIGFVNQKGILF